MQASNAPSLVSRDFSQVKLVDKHGNTVLLLNYAYNNTGTISTITGNSTNTSEDLYTVTEKYRYDPLQRLTNSTVKNGGPTTTLWFEYDNLGNRLRQSQSSVLTSYVYNLATNWLTSSTSSGSTTYYTFNNVGRMVQKSVSSTLWTYVYDVPGNLLKVTSGGVTKGTYAYDARGRRVESVEGSATTFYAYRGTETLYEKTGSAVTDYVFAAGLRIAKVTGSSINYYHSDHLGSVRLVTDNTDNLSVLFSNGYYPFGTDNGASGTEKHKYTGKPWSTDSQLYYNYHRWYDPSVGRFISKDPRPGKLSNPQNLNPYPYVRNLPTILNDPAGEAECDWNPFTWGGCAENVYNAAVETIVKPAVTFAVGAADVVSAVASDVWEGLQSVGATIWDRLETTGSVLNSYFVPILREDPLGKIIRQGLEQTADFLSEHIKITNMDKFVRGMVSCGILAVIVVGTVYSGGAVLHAYGVASSAAAITVGTAGVGAATLASPEFALGLTHAAEGLINLGAGCLEGLSTIQIG